MKYIGLPHSNCVCSFQTEGGGSSRGLPRDTNGRSPLAFSWLWPSAPNLFPGQCVRA